MKPLVPLTLLMLALCAATAGAWADRGFGGGHGFAPPARDERDRAADIARERMGNNGRILNVRPERSDDGRSNYRVKILDKGRVQVLDIDNEAGRVRD